MNSFTTLCFKVSQGLVLNFLGSSLAGS